jgi:hypothetical protein
MIDNDDDDDDDDCGTIGRMRIGRENWSTWRKPAPVPHCPPQLSHDLTQAQATYSKCCGHLQAAVVTLLEVIYSSIQVSNVLVLNCSLQAHQYFLPDIPFLFLKCPLVSHLILFRLSPLVSLESCNHSNHGFFPLVY